MNLNEFRGPILSYKPHTSGAIICLVIEESILFVKRSQSMPTHKGQVALIGGHRSLEELDPIVTAKREFEEETGLEHSLLNPICELPMVNTARGVGITPLVMEFLESTEYLKRFLRKSTEWDDAFMINFAYLFNEKLWSKGTRLGKTKSIGDVLFCPLSEEARTSLIGASQGTLLLWGATAEVIWNFRKKILTKS